MSVQWFLEIEEMRRNEMGFEIYLLTACLFFGIMFILNRKTVRNPNQKGKVMTESVYTESVVANVVEAYVAVVDLDYAARTAVVQELADELGVKVASVRAKLVAEKVYKAKEATVKAATGGKTKADYVKAMEAVSGLTLGTFTKASKAELKGFWEFIVASSDKQDADSK
jgi:hypothetical protein